MSFALRACFTYGGCSTQGLKPPFLWLETARLKPRPFKEPFMKHAPVPAKGYENEM